MKYWWYKLEGGMGIVPANEAAYFIQGRELHEDLAMYAQGRTVGEVVGAIPPPTQQDQITLELHTRRVGWATAFGLYIEPTLKAFGEEVQCEAEVVLDRSPLWIGVIPDRVQRRKGGGLVYREWKSARSLRKEWQDHWLYAIQIHLGIAALEEELGER